MVLFGLIGGQWRAGSTPTPAHLAAAASALRREGSKAAGERAAVVSHLAEHAAAAAVTRREGSAAAAAAVLCSSDLLVAVADALDPSTAPSQETIEAASLLATRLAAASPAAAAAVADSGLVGALAALLSAPSTAVSPDAKLDILACFRTAASRAPVREAMEAEGAPAAVLCTLREAAEAGDWPLAGDAAWAVEMMAGWSRRLTSCFGEAGGVEACVALLESARRQQPSMRELPRNEEAAEAATSALHALLVLLTDNRRNRVRLQRAGGASELASAFQDERLGWEAREQAVGLLQDLAAALEQDIASEAPPGTASPAITGGARPPGAQQAQQAQREEWRRTLLPALVSVLQSRRGQQLQESKEAAAGVLAKYAANGAQYAAAAGAAGALGPLVQLLQVGVQLAAGERRTAIAALLALSHMVGEPGCQEELLGPCLSASGHMDLLGLLRRLLSDATAPELRLSLWPSGISSSLNTSILGAGSASSTGGSHLVAAGWHAARVAARLCQAGSSVTQQLQLQDAAAARGLLPLLSRFVECEVTSTGQPTGQGGAVAAAAAAAAAALAGGRPVDVMCAIQVEVAGLLRALSMRRTHHAALRACPGLLPRLRALAQPGAPGWVELKADAKKILQNLGEVPDTDRPLLTYTPQQLGALLEGQGIQAARFVERGVTGAEFVRLSDSELQGLALLGQQGRVLRVLRAFEAFSEIDGCGPRTSSIGLAKLAVYLGNRGFRQAEVVPLAESLLGLMDGDRDDAASFPDFLQAYDEFLARTMSDLQPPSKRRRTDSRQ